MCQALNNRINATGDEIRVVMETIELPDKIGPIEKVMKEVKSRTQPKYVREKIIEIEILS